MIPVVIEVQVEAGSREEFVSRTKLLADAGQERIRASDLKANCRAGTAGVTFRGIPMRIV